METFKLLNERTYVVKNDINTPCSVLVERYRGKPKVLCSSSASIQIEGKNYCKKHAGLVLLDMLVNGRLKIKDDNT